MLRRAPSHSSDGALSLSVPHIVHRRVLVPFIGPDILRRGAGVGVAQHGLCLEKVEWSGSRHQPGRPKVAADNPHYRKHTTSLFSRLAVLSRLEGAESEWRHACVLLWSNRLFAQWHRNSRRVRTKTCLTPSMPSSSNKWYPTIRGRLMAVRNTYLSPQDQSGILPYLGLRLALLPRDAQHLQHIWV